MPLISRYCHIAINIHCLGALLVYLQRVSLHLLCAFMLCSWRAARDWTDCCLSSSTQICCATVSSSHVCFWTRSVGPASYFNLACSGELILDILLKHLHGNISSVLREASERFFEGHRDVHQFHWAGHERKSLRPSLFLKAWCSLPFLSISKPLMQVRLACKDASNCLLGWVSLWGRLQVSE